MNLLPEELRTKAGDHLVRLIEADHWHLGTGFLGTPYLLAALTESGHSYVAYRLLLSTGYPSWGYLIEHGATTMWERWNGDQKKSDPSMNSCNHYAYGAVADWIYRYAAGIDTIRPRLSHHLLASEFQCGIRGSGFPLRLALWPHLFRLETGGAKRGVASDHSCQRGG